MKLGILAALAALLAVSGIAGGVALAAGTSPTASCTPSPTVQDVTGGSRITVVCTVPKPAPVTTTVTVPGPTVTMTATPTPSSQPTTTAPTTTPSATPSTSAPAPATTPPTNAPVTGFPNASTTGVPAGTVLRKVPSEVSSGIGWTWDVNAGMVRADDGAVLDALDIAGGIEVYGTNVTISRVRAVVKGNWWVIGVRGGTATVKDSTLSGNGSRVEVGIKDVCGCSDITVLRNDIADWTSGIQMSRGLVDGNYVHDPKLATGDHINGFTDNGGRKDGTLTISNNTFLNTIDQTDAISLFQDFGTIQNVTVDHNLLAGGSYCLYAGGGDKGKSSNVVIRNNQFSTRYRADCGVFGPVAAYDGGVGDVWSNNTWADGPKAGQPVTP